jgi:glycogen debranching enzyme
MGDDEHPPRLAPEVAQPSADGGGRALELPVSGETEPLVLSRGNLFCVTNQRGDIAPAGARDLGLFANDTRHLSYLELFIAGGPPVALSSDTHGAANSQIDLTLTDSQFGGFLSDPQNFLHIRRKQLLDGELVEQITLTNHLRRPVDLWIELRMAADFADVFEVRGARRKRRGTLRAPQHAGDQLIFSYQGLDGECYRTVLRFLPEPRRVGPTGPFWDLRLDPGEATVLQVVVQPLRSESASVSWVPYDVRLGKLRDAHQAFVAQTTRVRCNNLTFEDALTGDLEDIDALRLRLGEREILGAGIPWFAAPFGRDAILTSFELLSIAPELAVETLQTLAAYQGTRFDDWREEEPGKIMHELRRGEMVRTGEIPHSPYYGSIDATPLWLMLLGETYRWQGDRALLQRLLPNAEAALAWIERRLDEGGGFVRFQRKHDKGLENQGWKDSRDGVSFPDGRLARTPIALVEVQGYAVGALDAMARVLVALGDPERASRLTARARALEQAIHHAFWVEDSRFYALALDGEDRQVPTIASNPGHLLFARAIAEEHAGRVVDVLLADELYSGFGVRTLARGQAVYNPLSYHNGSVWPHDNAICAHGAAIYGRTNAALQIFEGLYEASQHFRRGRLPELFCGLGRAEGDFLVHYPVSCSPQAWASGAFFLLLQSVLGIEPDAPRGLLHITNPRMPSFLERLQLVGLRVGDARVTLHFERHEKGRCHVDVVDRSAPIAVHIDLG